MPNHAPPQRHASAPGAQMAPITSPPQFERFSAQPPPAPQPPHHAAPPAASHGAPSPPRYAPDPVTAPPRPPQHRPQPQPPNLRGAAYDQFQQPGQPTGLHQPPPLQTAPPRDAHADPSSYNLGAYMPNARTEPGFAPRTQPPSGMPGHMAGHGQPQGYDRHPSGYGDAPRGWPQPPEEPGIGYAHGGASHLDAQYGEDPHGQAYGGRDMVAEADHDYDDEEDYEEEPRRSRGFLIVGALVGAIALGGGLAFAYKQLLAPQGIGKPPIVKADRAPARTAPADVGGKQFANKGV
jgi:hypothetical protein